jgi:hypothetical protein
MKKIKLTSGLPPLTKVYGGQELKKKNYLRPGAYSLDTTPSLYCGMLYYPNGKTKEYVGQIGDCDDLTK